MLRQHFWKKSSLILIIGSIVSSSVLSMVIAEGILIPHIKKMTKNEDRFKNNSTAPSAIRLRIRDLQHPHSVLDVVVRNDDFANFIMKGKSLSFDSYVRYMTANEGKVLEINLFMFKCTLKERWYRNAVDIDAIFNKHYVFKAPISFNNFNVANEEQLIKKYFVYDRVQGYGVLKGEFYENFTRNPDFIALLLELGYDVTWGDLYPNLNIYEKPFISHMEGHEQ